MNEIEPNKKSSENQEEMQTQFISKKQSYSSKQWDLGKKSTQVSSNINYEINQTQMSLQNIYGENKFKIQYEITKKEENAEKRTEKRFSKFEIKIDHRKNSKIKNLSSRTSDNFNIKSQFIEIKSRNNNNFETIESTNTFLKSNNINVGFSHSVNKKIRKDAFGNIILKKSKKHKVSFFDLLQQKDELANRNNKNSINYGSNSARDTSSNLVSLYSKSKLDINKNSHNFYNFNTERENAKKEFIEVIKIESFKRYNLSIKEDDNAKAICSPCGCSIF